jgi:hypothetical protein
MQKVVGYFDDVTDAEVALERLDKAGFALGSFRMIVAPRTSEKVYVEVDVQDQDVDKAEKLLTKAGGRIPGSS